MARTPILDRGLAARTARDERGAAAVEFAIVATPFFLLLFAVLEITFMFFVTTTLEGATMEAGRRIRTGEMQNADSTAEEFRLLVCEKVAALLPCDANIKVDVRVYTDFDDVTPPSPVEDGEFNDDALEVDFGDAGDIVVVRVYYLWKVFMPQLGTGLSNLNGGYRLIQATAAFRNEPFNAATAGVGS